MADEMKDRVAPSAPANEKSFASPALDVPASKSPRSWACHVGRWRIISFKRKNDWAQQGRTANANRYSIQSQPPHG